jgi:hypothetical protein
LLELFSFQEYAGTENLDALGWASALYERSWFDPDIRFGEFSLDYPESNTTELAERDKQYTDFFIPYLSSHIFVHQDVTTNRFKWHGKKSQARSRP